MATARPTPVSHPTLSGPARPGRRTKLLAPTLHPGDIVVIDHADLDALAARTLVDARPAAVINARAFITGRYPNRGPAVLLAAGVPLYQLPDPALFDRLDSHASLTIGDDGLLSQHNRPVCALELWDAAHAAEATAAARANLAGELTRFARNTLEYLDADKDLLLDPTDVPALRPGIKIKGRHALIVVRGEGYKEDLLELRPYLRDVRPVLIAVDGAADALIEIGHTPHIILGDMDSVTDHALRCGAQLIVHAYKATAERPCHAPGLARLQSLGLSADTFAVPGTSEDAALLLADEHGASLLVAVGTHSNLEDFLDKGRAGMASTFLTRLKVGPRLVDARGVSTLYRPSPPPVAFLAMLLSALFPLIVVLIYSPAPILRNLVETVRLWYRLHIR